MRLKITALMALFAAGAMAQEADPVVMSVDRHDITRSEFEYYYNKENADTTYNIDVYAQQFALRKLKVYKALDMKLDTTATVRAEAESYRGTLAKTYLTDAEAEEREARTRYTSLSNKLSQGYVRVSRIFRRMPQNVTNRTMHRTEQQMDSIYSALQKSPLMFADFVVRFSDDKQTSDVHPLQTTEDFEKHVFSLKEGEMSAPFYTPEGIQIVKVIERGALPDYEEMKAELKEALTHRTTGGVVERLKSECSFAENEKAVSALLAGDNSEAQLFTIAGKGYSVAGFNKFAAAYPRQRSKQYEAFVMKSLMDYESTNIEKLHPEFEMELKEHHENLLIAEYYSINKPSAQEYRQGVEEYFENHRSDYKWDSPKYRGVAVRCTDEQTARRIKKEMKKIALEQWPDTIAARYTLEGKAIAVAEYGLFSKGDNDVVDFMVFGEPTVNTSGDYPRAFVVGKKQKRAESVEEAGEPLQEAYQNHLLEQSVKQLKQGSQVEIKQEVLKTVNNH